MDLYLQILEVSLDAKTWVDYLVEQVRDSMHSDPNNSGLSDIAVGVERLDEKVKMLKHLLSDYISEPVQIAARQYPDFETVKYVFLSDDGYPNDTLLGKYYAVGTQEVGYDIQFLTPEMHNKLLREHPDWQIIELRK